MWLWSLKQKSWSLCNRHTHRGTFCIQTSTQISSHFHKFICNSTYTPDYTLFTMQDGQSALMEAASRPYTDIVLMLIHAGANTNLQNKVCHYIPYFIPVSLKIIIQRGETALMRATSCGRMANVEQLIKAKANLDLQNLVCQLTWLYIAIFNPHVHQLLHRMELLL